jgi:serine phosphatase RsbU (regulator of sigma subunit)
VSLVESNVYEAHVRDYPVLRSELDQLAEALMQANDRQLRLYELGRLNVETFDSQATIDRLLAMALKLTDSSAVVLIEPGGNVLRERTFADRSLVDQVVQHGRGWRPGGEARRAQTVGQNHSLQSEVRVGEATYKLGIGKSSSQGYGTPDQKMLDAIAVAFGSSLKLLALHEQALSAAIVETEHNMAASIVASALSESVRTFAPLETSASTVSARVVGGDFYVAVAHDHGLRFVVGDVAGKGLPAAVLMSNAVTVAHMVLRNDYSDDPVACLREMSRALNGILSTSGRFITMVVGALIKQTDGDDFDLRLANAGHSPVCVLADQDASDAPLHFVSPLTPPVGVIPLRSDLVPFEMAFGPGSCLLMGSDGLAEQENPTGEHFGLDRLERVLRSSDSAPVLRDSILEAVRVHADGTAPSDDQTVFVVSYPKARGE